MSVTEGSGRRDGPGGPEITVLLADGAGRSLPEDVRTGLSSLPKEIPPKHFYDSIGSELFDLITRLPEYYPTRAERQVLSAKAREIARLTATAELVELGSGSADKALMLIEAIVANGTLRSYMPVDVSERALRAAAREVAARFPGITVHAVAADIERHLGDLPAATGRRTIALLGGTIGNFQPAERRDLLRSMAGLAGGDGHLLIGLDKVKPAATLVAAYDDAAGVTARFNLNLLEIINRELDGDLDVSGFGHEARWNGSQERIEMHLRAKKPMSARIGALDLDVTFDEGETILTETSAKFTRERWEEDLAAAGLVLDGWFEDEEGLFALTVAGHARS